VIFEENGIALAPMGKRRTEQETKGNERNMDMDKDLIRKALTMAMDLLCHITDAPQVTTWDATTDALAAAIRELDK
jgi:hypothetical protein